MCTEANENVRYALFLLSCPIHQFLVTLEYGGERVVKLSKSLNWSACTQAQPEKDEHWFCKTDLYINLAEQDQNY